VKYSVLDRVRRTARSSRRPAQVLVVTVSLLFAPMLQGMASATCSGTQCDPVGTTELNGSDWLGGAGVTVYSNGSNPMSTYGDNYQMTPSGTNVYTGYKWQCVELINRLYAKQGWISTRWTGNGGDMYDTAPSSFTKEPNGSIASINNGDVIVLQNGGAGHVGIVSGVAMNGDGTKTVSIVNQNTSFVVSTAKLTGQTLSSPYNGFSVKGVVHAPGAIGGSGASSSTRIGALTSDGTLYVKDGNLGAPWVNELSFVSATHLSGNRIGALTSDGTLYVKEGDLSAPWVTEMTGVTSFALDGTRIAVVTGDGTLYVKDGGLGAGWVTELGSVSAVSLSGNRIGAISGGTLYVKEGDLGAGWVAELGGVSAVSLSGNRIGAISGGTLYVKEGTLYAGWVAEMGSASGLSLSGNRIGVVAYGNLYVKEGTLGAGWVEELDGASATALSGNRIGVLSGGSYFVKEGTLGSAWVTELGGVAGIALN
jgi:hypothetical protein